MAIAKVVYKESSTATPSTWMDVTQKTVTSATMLSSITALKNDGTNITGTIATKSVGNLWFSSSTATFGVPAGYYSGTGAIFWTIASKSAETFVPAETAQTISSYQWLTGSQTIAAISSDYVGTGIIRQGVGGLAIDTAGVIYANAGYYSETVSMNMNTVSAKTITPTESIQRAVSSHYWTTGHISVAAISSTYVGTGITTRTSLLSNASKITAREGYYPSDIAMTVGAGKVGTSATTIIATPTLSLNSMTGVITGTVNSSSSISPYVITQGWVSSVTNLSAGTISVSGNNTLSLTTESATTIYPSTVAQTILSGRYLTGTQTFAPVMTLNLEASYIASGVTVQVGDSANASRIAQVTGTLQGAESFARIYKSLAFRSNIYSTHSLVSEWANSLSILDTYQFAGMWFSGSFIFGNVSSVALACFETPKAAYTVGRGIGAYFYFPSCTVLGSEAFANNLNVKYVEMPLVSEIAEYAFYSCAINSASFNNCTTIGTRAFANCIALSGELNFPDCETISSYAFYSCSRLSTISFSQCTYVGDSAFASCWQLTQVSLPLCVTISNFAFQSCTSLVSINMPKCETIGSYAFLSCKKITNADFPECISIGNFAFSSCIALTSISLPKCTMVAYGTFSGCSSLASIEMPLCTSIYGSGFFSCSTLSIAIFPSCSIVGESAFYRCFNLETINISACTEIYANAFTECSVLTSVNLPNCIGLSSNAFNACVTLSNVSLPVCSVVGSSAMRQCSALTMISLPNVTSVGNYAFSSCLHLESVYLMGSSIASFGTQPFVFTPIYSSSYLGHFGSIYVPSSLLATYKTTTNLTTYSSRMVGI